MNVPAPPNLPGAVQNNDILKPKGARADPMLYMYNESNMYMMMLISCALLVVAICMPKYMPNIPNIKWLAVLTSALSVVLMVHNILVYRRNITAFENNESKYIQWDSSSTFIYGICCTVLVIGLTVSYELYWGASATTTSMSTLPPEIAAAPPMIASAPIMASGGDGASVKSISEPSVCSRE